MSFDRKKVFSYAGAPDPLASSEEKATPEYGLAYAKFIEQSWFDYGGNGQAEYYNKRDKYHRLRMYARGEQSTQKYRDLLTNGEDTTYLNLDFSPIQVIPKFINLTVNQMSERLFELKAEATDKYSTDLKDTYKKSLEDLMYGSSAMHAAKDIMGVDLFPQNYDELPATEEEINLHMELKYKPAIEIATEEALKFTLDLNDYKEIQTRVLNDITVLGLAGIKHNTDPVKGITVEYVDPADTVYSFPKDRDFKDVYYYGEVKRLTIGEVKRLSQGTFTDEEIKEIYQSTTEWSRFQGYNSNNEDIWTHNSYANKLVDVLFFTFKTTKTISYKKKFSRNGGFKMTPKDSTFTKGNAEYDGFEVAKKTIDVWYSGSLILGTDKLFGYKLVENMIRPEGNLNITYPNYIFYAPEIYQNRSKSLVERIIPYVDQMQQIHIKLQQMIAKARPNGIYIDVAGLNEVSLGDGNSLTPLEAIKIYDETGNILGSSLTQEGEFNYGREPIRELKNGVIDGLDRLINAYNHYLNLVRDAIGIPQGADASAPHPDMAVGVQQQLAASSNVATRHVLEGCLNMTRRLGKGLTLRLKDIFLYSDLKEVYINAVGKINVQTLEAIKKFHLHDLGILIDLKPDAEQKQYLEQNINMALSKDLITLDDAIDIRNISNVKLANELIKTRRVRREKQKQDNAKEMQQQQAEGQAMVVERASAARTQETTAKLQLELQLVQAKSQAKKDELQAEAAVKSKLMEQEFSYNMQLQGRTADASAHKMKYTEDRKDARQTMGNSQDSQKIQQKQFSLPAKNFESSEDNLSGSVELGEMEPH